MSLFQFFTDYPIALIFCVVVLSLLVGSFLNVVIHRLPIMMERDWRNQCSEFLNVPNESASKERFNIAYPPSRCPHCGHRITARENIPVVSYIMLGGRCSACGKSISIRYPIIELITGVMSGVVAWQYGYSIETAGALLLTYALIALTVIDFDRQLLPDDITLPFLWLGMMISTYELFTDMTSAIFGAVAGYLVLWAVYKVFKWATGKEGMGYGDFKLLAMLGAWLGWQSLPVIILLSSLVGAVVGITLIVVARHDRSIPIPFGPYLAAAGWIYLLWGERIAQAYLNYAGVQ
jgi:leader peptidase (prepilin peptidase)/N-methyltransferase